MIPKVPPNTTSIGHQEPTITGFGRPADAEPLSSDEQMTPLSSGRYLDAAELPRRGHFSQQRLGKSVDSYLPILLQNDFNINVGSMTLRRLPAIRQFD
jgi:hypothetical protein